LKHLFAREVSPTGGDKSDTNANFPETSKILERNHSSHPQISFGRSIVLINICLLAENEEIYCAVFEKQRVAAKMFAPLFSKSMGSNVRLKTYLLQLMFLYTHIDFEDQRFSGGQEILGVPKIFEPQQFRPPAGDTPVSRKIYQVRQWKDSQEISSKSIEPFPRNSTMLPPLFFVMSTP
jgi:hypothetical protein